MQQNAEARDESKQATRGPMDRVYFLHVWALMVTGIVFVFSASFPTAGRPDALMLPGNPFYFVTQHAQFVGIGLVVLLATSLFPPQWLRSLAPVAFVVGLGLIILTLSTSLGRTIGGATRWLKLPGLPMFQPSELMKLALLLMMARVLAQKDEGEKKPRTSYLWVLAIVAVAAGLVLMQPDMGMATIYVAIAFAMVFFAGARLKKLVPLAFVGMAGALLIAYLADYRWRRIIAFIDLENAPARDRYHILNMLIAQARGGIFGMGLGMSPDKWRSLPAAHTDSIFSVIGCEMGMLGAVVVLIVLGLLTWRGLQIARSSARPFGFYVAAGVAAMLCLQSLMHIAVNTGCMPVTGLTLPFISGGGTSLIAASIGAGMVLAVSRYQRPGEA